MQNSTTKDTLANDPKLCYNELDIKPSKDTTFALTLSEEKLLKRLRQVGSGLFFVVMLDNEPVITVIGGRVEMLKKLVS